MKNYLLLFGASFIFCCSLNAQTDDLKKGYYIDQGGKRNDGYFELSYLRDNIIKYYKAPKEQSETKLKPRQVQSVNCGEQYEIMRYPIVIEQDTEWIFIQKAAHGGINLYTGVSISQGTLFFINEQGNDKILKISPRAPGQMLQTLFPDCKYDGQVVYNESRIIKAIDFYNKCKYPAIYLNTMGKSARNHEWWLGTNFFNFWVKPTSGNQLSGKYDLDRGQGVGFFVRWNYAKQFNFLSGVNYFKKDYKISYTEYSTVLEYELNGQRMTGYILLSSPMEFKLKFIEVPLSLDWIIIPNRKFSPFISTGVYIHFPISRKIDPPTEIPRVLVGAPTLDYSNITAYVPKYFEKTNIGFSLFGGIGLQYKITPNILFLIKGLYASDQERYILIANTLANFHGNRLSLMTGISYNLTRYKQHHSKN